MNALPPYTISIAAMIVILTGVLILLRISLAERRLRLSQLQRPAEVSKQSARILSDPEWAELQRMAKADFEMVVKNQAATLAGDLKSVSTKISQQVQQLSTTVIEQEIEQYQKALTTARLASLQTLTKLQRSIDGRKEELEGELKREMQAQREQLTAKLDQKLAEIISAYVVEALGKDTDLSAQSDYIFKSLEQAKTALRDELADEV